jgi:hypothetical protein
MSLYLSSTTINDFTVSDTIYVTNLSGNVFITNDSDVTNTSINNKIVHPSGFKYFVNNATIGSTKPAKGNFLELTASSISGNVIATNSEAAAGSVNNKVITPSNLNYTLKNPTTIGSTKIQNANFTLINANDISGNIIAGASDLSSSTKLMTPYLYSASLSNPTTIGSTSAGDATFTTLKVLNNFTFNGNLSAAGGGTGITSYTKGDLLAGNGTGLSKFGVGANGTYLVADSTKSTGMTWKTIDNTGNLNNGITMVKAATNTEAIDTSVTDKALVPSNVPSIWANIGTIGSGTPNTAKFVNVTTNNLALTNGFDTSVGGTGISSYTKGDILVGNSSNTLSKLPLGANGQILGMSGSNIAWINVPGVSDSVSSSIPSYYLNCDEPILNSSKTTCTFGYVIATANDNTTVITLTNYTFTLSSNVLQSSTLSGTISTNSKTVTGSGTTFTTSFIVGDVLFANGIGRRIVSISSNTSLTVESSFGSNLSSVTYKRGGLAPNTKYVFYANSSDIYLSVRRYSDSDTIVDLPTGTIDIYRQLPFSIYYTSTGFANIIKESSDYPSKYMSMDNPTYVSSSQYTVNNIKCRNALDTDNIDVNIPQTIDISTFGQGGLEQERTLTGTISTSGLDITGSGTSFTSDLVVGDYIGINGIDVPVKVTAITNDTSLKTEYPADNGGQVKTTFTYDTVTSNVTPFNIGSSIMVGGSSINSKIYFTDIPKEIPNQWTLELWYYQTNVNTNAMLISANNSFKFIVNIGNNTATVYICYYGDNLPTTNYDVRITSATVAPTSKWNHFALVYDSNQLIAYVNGNNIGSSICGNVPYDFFGDLSLCNSSAYYDDVRYSNIARYTGVSCQIPSEPLTSDANTIFLQSFDNYYGVVTTGDDILTGLSNLKSPVITTWTKTNITNLSNTKYKFGQYSLSFSASLNSYYSITGLPNIQGLSAWTVECWVYMNTTAGAKGIFGTNVNYRGLYVNSNAGALTLGLSMNGTSYDTTSVSSSVVSANTWFHIAVVYTGTKYLFFVNGTLIDTINNSTKLGSNTWTSFILGYAYNGSVQNYIDGNIDDFRISSIARYTASFAVPSSANVADNNTIIINNFDNGGYLNSITTTDSYNVKWTTNGYTDYTAGYSTTTKKFGAGSLNLINTGIFANLGYNSVTSLPSNPIVSDLPSGLSLWIDASDSTKVDSTLNPTNNSTIYDVVKVTDKSNNAAVLAINTVASSGYPNYSANGIRFNASAYLTTTGGPTYTGNYSVFTVFNYTTFTTTNTIIWSSSGTLGTTGAQLKLVTGVNLVYTVGSTDYTIVTGTQVGKTYLISIIADNSGTSTIYVNGVSVITFTPGSSNTFSSMDFGGWSGGGVKLNGNLYEMQMYNSTLSTVNRQRIEKKLMSKWNMISNITTLPNSTSWTLECWFRLNSVSGNTNIFGNALGNIINVGTINDTLTFNLSSNGLSYNLLSYTSGSLLSANTWYHIAVCFNGSNYYALFNGSLLTSSANSNFVNVNAFGVYFGIGVLSGTTFNGYIDDFRFSNAAKYTSNYTLPATELTGDSSTLSLNNFNSVSVTQNTHLDVGNLVTLKKLTSQSYSIKTSAPNCIYYPYIFGGKAPCIVLSPRSNQPSQAPSGYSLMNCRQLPFVMITDSNKNLYEITWDKTQGSYMNAPTITLKRWAKTPMINNTNVYSDIDFSKYIPTNSTVALADYRLYTSDPTSTTATTVTSLTLRNVTYYSNNYNLIFNSVTQLPTQQLHYTPLNDSQKVYLELAYSGTLPNIDATLISFFMNKY